ncbi:hypothetical protein [Streptomyces sp. NPDC059786]|uniref:hypothetical protein n=1 Tax=Streptomyces sp. NPDC059786 TaxID=3346946 RepID=UPI00365CD502
MRRTDDTPPPPTTTPKPKPVSGGPVDRAGPGRGRNAALAGLALAVLASTAQAVPAAAAPPRSDGAVRAAEGVTDPGPVRRCLDLPLVNGDGERAGGVHPALPTDAGTLRAALDAVRAAHVAPSRYRALLWQYWLVRAADDAGIELTGWAPDRGVEANRRTVVAVYAYYGALFLRHPELRWAGMANLAGPSFAAGFMDLDMVPDLARLLAGRIAAQPPEARDRLPTEVRDLARDGTGLTDLELGWFAARLLAMQKHIFMDQAAMHAAYLYGGTAATDEMRSAGLIDAAAAASWHGIAGHRPQDVDAANTQLLSREQNQIIAGQWDRMRARLGPVGGLVTYAITLAGSVSVPGARTPAQYAPLTVATEPGVTSVRLITPLPAFNIADRARRWQYITGDTLPAYRRLLRERPAWTRTVVGSSLEDRIARERLAARWPELVTELVTGWRVEARL